MGKQQVNEQLNRILDIMYHINEASKKADWSAGRVHFDDIMDLLNTIDIGRSFVGLSYIQAYPLKKVYPGDEEFSSKFSSEIDNGDAESRIHGKLSTMRDSDEFKNPQGRKYRGLNSMSSVPFNGIVKVTNYVFNWGNTEHLSDFFNNQRELERKIRIDHGFGQDFYPDGDWRTHPDFRGTGEYPEVKSSFMGTYRDKIYGDYNLYGDTDELGNSRFGEDGKQKLAFKMALTNPKAQYPTYYLVDNNGEIDEVSKSLYSLFRTKSMPKNLASNLTNNMSAEEVEARKMLSDLSMKNAMAYKQWLLDNILYIAGAGVDRNTGNKVPFIWLNKGISLDIDINQNELDSIISGEFKRFEKDLD